MKTRVIYIYLAILVVTGVALYFILRKKKTPPPVYEGSKGAGGAEGFTGTQREFITTFAPEIIRGVQGSGIFPSVAIAMAANESGWGRSGLVQRTKNLFNIKAFSTWTGPKVQARDKAEGSNDFYRQYSSYPEGVKDFVNLITKNNYKNVPKQNSPEAQISELQRTGSGKKAYATDPGYKGKILSIIKTYGLEKYDTYR